MSERVAERYEIINHGVDQEQYFQGCGTAHTDFEECFTGIGENAYDALEDALEQAAAGGWDVETVPNDFREDAESDIPLVDEDGEDDENGEPAEGFNHYVSLRLTSKVDGDEDDEVIDV